MNTQQPTFRNHFHHEVLALLIRNFVLHDKNYMLQSEIIEELGITKQLFYHHMKSKKSELEKLGVKVIKSPYHKSYKIFVLDTVAIEKFFHHFNIQKELL